MTAHLHDLNLCRALAQDLRSQNISLHVGLHQNTVVEVCECYNCNAHSQHVWMPVRANKSAFDRSVECVWQGWEACTFFLSWRVTSCTNLSYSIMLQQVLPVPQLQNHPDGGSLPHGVRLGCLISWDQCCDLAGPLWPSAPEDLG